MLFFIDESGQDHKETPYEVLAGISIHEKELWPFIQEIQDLELRIYGIRLDKVDVEIKGKKLLKRKVFRFAGQGEKLENLDERRQLCKEFLEKGTREEKTGKLELRSKREFTAYGQATLDFIHQVFTICTKYNVKVFASIVNPDTEKINSDFLRKDYSYLFERFFYSLEDFSETEMGLIVFDELENTQCRILIAQMEKYFSSTARGTLRSSRIIPEPFFVHSDLTMAIQVVDLIAYTINWVVRLNKMNKEKRKELEEFGKMVFDLRYIGKRKALSSEKEFPIYGITYIEDLRPRSMKIS